VTLDIETVHCRSSQSGCVTDYTVIPADKRRLFELLRQQAHAACLQCV